MAYMIKATITTPGGRRLEFDAPNIPEEHGEGLLRYLGAALACSPNRCAACCSVLQEPLSGGRYHDPFALCVDCKDPCPNCDSGLIMAPKNGHFICLACGWDSEEERYDNAES